MDVVCLPVISNLDMFKINHLGRSKSPRELQNGSVVVSWDYNHCYQYCSSYSVHGYWLLLIVQGNWLKDLELNVMVLEKIIK